MFYFSNIQICDTLHFHIINAICLCWYFATDIVKYRRWSRFSEYTMPVSHIAWESSYIKTPIILNNAYVIRKKSQRPLTFIIIKQGCIFLYTLTCEMSTYNEYFLSFTLCRDSILNTLKRLFNEFELTVFKKLFDHEFKNGFRIILYYIRILVDFLYFCTPI